MSSCCGSKSYGAIFSEKAARRALRRYRRRGLDKLSKRIAETVRERGVAGMTLLEVGGGIGALEVELLEAGAEHATNVELSPEYEQAAGELARERRVEQRVERRVADFAGEPDVPAADAVLMNRVVCCYPDYETLVGAAAQHARRLLVMTFPRERFLTRAAFAAMNTWLRLVGNEFRGYVHPVRAVVAVAERAGFAQVAQNRGIFWQLAALERS